MKLKRDRKFGEKSTCPFKIGITNLTNFDVNTRKSQKIFILMGSFWANYIFFELKKYKEVIFHETEEDPKFGEKSTCRFKIDIRNLTNFDLSTQLLNKVYIFWAKKVRRSYLSWHWRVMQNLKKLTCCLENERNMANFHQSTWKCQNWNFDGTLLSKVENVWAQNLQRSYVSWQWRIIQKLKRNWLVVLKLTWGTSQILTQAFESLKNLRFNWLHVTKGETFSYLISTKW